MTEIAAQIGFCRNETEIQIEGDLGSLNADDYWKAVNGMG